MITAAVVFALACTASAAPAAPATPPAPAAAVLDDAALAALHQQLVQKHGKGQSARLTRGLRQAAALWRADDGDAAAFAAFAAAQFVSDKPTLDATLARFEAHFEQIDGHLLEIGRALRTPTDLDTGPLLPVDTTFSAFDVGAHLADDLFQSKLAFVVLLNFPLTTLSERLKQKSPSRADWAIARLTGRVARRVPAAVVQNAAAVSAAADLYIAEYNLWMHHVLDAQGRRLFPAGKKLISHWNLRDEIKAQYSAGSDGPARQRVIVRAMERIVTQTIPAAVINNPRVDWNPFTNAVTPAPAATVEPDAPKAAVLATSTSPEPNTRYAHLLAQFHAASAADAHSPSAPNAIQRAFEFGREMPEPRVRALFESVLSSPLVPRMAQEIERRLGRKLEPQDLWFDGFKSRALIPEAELDAVTRARYPNAQAFKDDLPRILRELGFRDEKATWLAERVVVDPSRGAGHALQAARRGDFPHLRTRVEKDGMTYKGYNIAVHELGHNVEQLFSLYGVDHTLLQGVPGNAFTEAIAFVFQARDLHLLGRGQSGDRAQAEAVLSTFWQTWEIAGVALVDVEAWRWMYAHPNATPEETKSAVVAIAADVWRRFYAPVLSSGSSGGSDGAATPLLGIYSHMIAYPLYLADYPLGHLIAFQIEEHLDKSTRSGRLLGDELERMCRQGNLAPDVWMLGATGAPVSAEPLLRAADRALATLSSTSGTAPTLKPAPDALKPKEKPRAPPAPPRVPPRPR